MSQITSVTVADRESTPVDHVFSRQKEMADGTIRFTNNSLEYPAGREFLTLRLSDATRQKARLVIGMPVMVTETINGVDYPKQIRYGEAVVEFRFDGTSTEQERSNMVGMIANLLAESQTDITDMIVGQVAPN
jgi:hypothetical protein